MDESRFRNLEKDYKLLMIRYREKHQHYKK